MEADERFAKADPLPRTLEIYDAIAPDYAGLWFSDLAVEPMLDRFVARLPNGADVLDMGCGPGRDVQSLAKRSCQVVGIDLAEGMLAEARARLGNQILRRMDMRSLCYPAATFHGVWACASLQNLPPPDAVRALSEVSRILVPGGILGISVEAGEGERYDHLGRYVKPYTPAELENCLMDAGLTVCEVTTRSSDKTTLGESQPRSWLQILAQKPDERLVREDKTCLFCPYSRFELTRSLPLGGSQGILWGDEDLWVFVDIAPLVEGHLLVVSTQHLPCFGAWPATLDGKLEQVKRLVRNLLEAAWGQPILVVEHGSARPKEAGTCIDHAHLHFLPTRLPVRAAVEARLGPGLPATGDALRRLNQIGRSYLYIEDGSGGWFFLVGNLPCQFLRQVIAGLQTERVWRWQSASGLGGVQRSRRRTLERLLPAVDRRMRAWECPAVRS